MTLDNLETITKTRIKVAEQNGNSTEGTVMQAFHMLINKVKQIQPHQPLKGNKYILNYCNNCGKELDFWDKQENFIIEKKLGYGTKYDGNKLKLQFCCECIDSIIENCSILPITKE